MYTQGLNDKDSGKGVAEDAAKLARFQAKIDAEDKIEPNDWMPEAYRRTLVRQISQHAPFRDHRHAARGQLAHAGAVAAGARRRCSPRCRTRPATASISIPPPRRSGVSREEMYDAAAVGQGQVLLDLQLSDADLGRHRRHRLAGRRRGDHEPDPALPLQLRPLRARHDPHLQGGELPPAPGLRDHGDALPRARAAQKAMAQDALNRWWWPSLMMFGPSDKESMHSADTTKWKIKRFSNDDLRQKFVDATVPQGHYLGLDVPRPRAEARRGERPLAVRRDRLVRVQARARRRRPMQPRAHEGAQPRRRRTAPGCARRRWRTRGSAPSARRRPRSRRSRRA